MPTTVCQICMSACMQVTTEPLHIQKHIKPGYQSIVTL